MTHPLTPWLPLPGDWRIRLEFKLADAWIGFYPKLDHSRLWTHFDLWICLLPCLPIHVAAEWPPR